MRLLGFDSDRKKSFSQSESHSHGKAFYAKGCAMAQWLLLLCVDLCKNGYN